MTNPSGPQFIPGGVRGGTSPLYQGTDGYYWSSSAYTPATYAYNLYLYGPNPTVIPANNGYKRAGFTLRCLAQNQIKNKKTPKLIDKRQNNKKKRSA